jgi:hypothetical protein
MADRVLRTDFKRIGRSGPTVDGRNISPQMIDDMAASYNKDLFTALIWPEHQRYVNYGIVEELRSAANEEGGRDLYAIISPNEFYTSSNHYGQKLFTSMEITVDFRKTGKAYLTGLGATDDPASAATSEIRLSATKQAGVIEAANVEAIDKTFEDTVQLTLLDQIKELFTKQQPEGNDMADKAAIQQLSTEMAEIKALFAKITPPGATDKPADEKPEETIVKLTARLEALEQKYTAQPDSAGITAEQFAALKTQLETFGQQLEDALKEQPGTDGGEHFSSDDKGKCL